MVTSMASRSRLGLFRIVERASIHRMLGAFDGTSTSCIELIRLFNSGGDTHRGPPSHRRPSRPQACRGRDDLEIAWPSRSVGTRWTSLPRGSARETGRSLSACGHHALSAHPRHVARMVVTTALGSYPGERTTATVDSAIVLRPAVSYLPRLSIPPRIRAGTARKRNPIRRPRAREDASRRQVLRPPATRGGYRRRSTPKLRMS